MPTKSTGSARNARKRRCDDADTIKISVVASPVSDPMVLSDNFGYFIQQESTSVLFQGSLNFPQARNVLEFLDDLSSLYHR